MAVGTNIQIKVSGCRGTSDKRIAAAASNRDLVILGMNIFFHNKTPPIKAECGAGLAYLKNDFNENSGLLQL